MEKFNGFQCRDLKLYVFLVFLVKADTTQTQYILTHSLIVVTGVLSLYFNFVPIVPNIIQKKNN